MNFEEARVHNLRFCVQSIFCDLRENIDEVLAEFFTPEQLKAFAGEHPGKTAHNTIDAIVAFDFAAPFMKRGVDKIGRQFTHGEWQVWSRESSRIYCRDSKLREEKRLAERSPKQVRRDERFIRKYNALDKFYSRSCIGRKIYKRLDHSVLCLHDFNHGMESRLKHWPYGWFSWKVIIRYRRAFAIDD